MGTRLMIIKLRKYNEIGELLYGEENHRVAGTSKLLGQGPEAPVTRAAVCMGVKEMGMQTG